MIHSVVVDVPALTNVPHYSSSRFLKQLRANRDEENELMKDVPNWKTGTLWGEPVYHNIANRFIMPSSEEFFAHCSYRQKYLAVNEKLKH